MLYEKLFQYYADQQFLPTFGKFENSSKLAEYALARRTVFTEKLALPVEMFKDADVLEFGPDSGENALVFASWGANLTLAEPNLRAHDQIRRYFEYFNLNKKLASLRSDDIEGFKSDRSYDIIDAEGFIYTVQPTSLWLGVFHEALKSGGYAIVSYYETQGAFIELVLKAIHSACKELTALSPEPAAQMLYETKWDSIPHTRPFSSWVHDVLENPFVRLRYFLDSLSLCQMAAEQGFELHSSWPLYRDALDIYWHKKTLSASELLQRNVAHLKRSRISFLSGQKMYLTGSADEIDACAKLVGSLLSDVDFLIEHPFDGRLKSFLSGLRGLKQIVGKANILVDGRETIDKFEGLITALEAVFTAIEQRNIEEVVRLTNTSPSFISAWGMPTHFLVLRKRSDTSPEAS